jgi:Putative Flp pilus-assembly TadE/G-like
LRRRRTNPDKKPSGREGGVVITLVAVFMLFVVGAMAALSVDVVSLYTARSEAQLAADSAVLAAARVLANSGATSDTTGASMPGAWGLAQAVALQVAEHNQVGGTNLTASEVTLNCACTGGSSGFTTDPTVTAQVTVTLPTFFARIWGSTQVTVAASATAEAYNPSNASGLSTSTNPPVAPLCVKPWLLPNIDPTQTNPATEIFDANGDVLNPALVGQSWPNTTVANPNANGIYSLCGGDCSPGAGGITAPAPGAYYPGAIDADDFPAPTQALPSCAAAFNAYQTAVAGCVQRPIVCGAQPASSINIDTNPYVAINGSRDADTVPAAACLIHYVTAAGDSDSVASGPPFEFLGGAQNPVAGAVGNDVLVSDSLVTIPVINNPPPAPPGTPTNPVQVIGFLQVFLNPSATQVLPYPNPPTSSFEIPATIINMAGCAGTSAGAQPIIGNGAGPVAVRLISPP